MLSNYVRGLEKKVLVNGENLCAIFMDFSKAFDTMRHNLLIAKLGAYGFSDDALFYMQKYFKNRQQRVHVNSSFSDWDIFSTGVPQGSILGPLLFNIFINDLFLFVSNSYLSNYADDNTLYTFGNDLKEVKRALNLDFRNVIEWFYENYMVLNADKCHFMCFGLNKEDETLEFDEISLKNSNKEKILGITIDNKLTFESHFTDLCTKTSQKIGVLSRIKNYLDDSKKKKK